MDFSLTSQLDIADGQVAQWPWQIRGMRTRITVGGNRVNQIHPRAGWVSGLALEWRLENFGGPTGCRRRLCFQDMLNYGRRKVSYDCYGRAGASITLPSMRTLACIALPCWKANISGKNSSSHGNWSMFILQTIRCWDTVDSYLTNLPDYRPLCSLIIAPSYQEAFSSQANQAPWPHALALPQGLLSHVPWEEGMEKSRNGKQTPDFANSPVAVGSFLLQCRSHRFWLCGSEAHELWVYWSESQQVLHWGVSFS